EGDNPQTWYAVQEHNDDLIVVDELGNKRDVTALGYKDSMIGLFKGKRYRITAEDFAGNRSSLVSDYAEEKFMITSLNGSNLVGVGNIGFSDLSPGLHKITGFETVHLPTAHRVLQ